ncbi:hypothetical protein BDW74DRAFT_155077 [Aspergillus multicolor]|uniref:uncharacterized protein n=1 Tax=Aspergillus multicolor TaxID=41759 RepID=UPI003CCDE9F7
MVRLSWLALSLLAGVAAAESEANKTEIDLIFPREGTFAPQRDMPVVFAIQNPSAANGLRANFQYGLRVKGQTNETKRSYRYQLDDIDIPANETTYFSSTSLGTLLNQTGTWEFSWSLYWLNCSTSADSAYNNTEYPWVSGALDGVNQDAVEDGFHMSDYQFTANSFSFEIKDGGATVNLTTLSGSDQCGDASGFVLPAIKGTTPFPIHFSEKPKDMDSCAVLDNSTLTLASATEAAEPCKVSIGAVAEASILAESKCNDITFSSSGCTDEQPKDDAAAGQNHGQAAWLAATLAVILGFGIVGY